MEHLPNEVLFHMMTFMDVASLQNFCQVFPALKETRHYAQCFLKAFLNKRIGIPALFPSPEKRFMPTWDFAISNVHGSCAHGCRLSYYPSLFPELYRLYPKSSDICYKCFIICANYHGRYPTAAKLWDKRYFLKLKCGRTLHTVLRRQGFET